MSLKIQILLIWCLLESSNGGGGYFIGGAKSFWYEYVLKDDVVSLRLPNRTQILQFYGRDPSSTAHWIEWSAIKIDKFGFLSSNLQFISLTSTELDRFGWFPNPPHNIIRAYNVEYRRSMFDAGCGYLFKRMYLRLQISTRVGIINSIIPSKISFVHIPPKPPRNVVFIQEEGLLEFHLDTSSRWSTAKITCLALFHSQSSCDSMITCSPYAGKGDLPSNRLNKITCHVDRIPGATVTLAIELESVFYIPDNPEEYKKSSTAVGIVKRDAPAPLIDKAELLGHTEDGLYTFKALLESEKKPGSLSYYDSVASECVVAQKSQDVGKIPCIVKEIREKIEYMIQIPAGLPHHIDFRAMAEIKGKPNKNFKVIEGDEMSQAPKGNRYIYYGGMRIPLEDPEMYSPTNPLPPKYLEIVVVGNTPNETQLNISWGIRSKQYVEYAETKCQSMGGFPIATYRWRSDADSTSMTANDIKVGNKYKCSARFKLFNYKGERLKRFTNETEYKYFILGPSQERYFSVSATNLAGRVRDGDFLFNLELVAYYRNVNITIDKYDWKTSSYTDSTQTIIPPHGSQINTTHTNVSADLPPDFFQTGLKYRFNMVINGYFGKQIDAKTKDFVLDIAPSAPYGVVAIQDVNKPVVRLMWALDPHSVQDNLTIKVCRGKQFSCPEKTILITPEESGKFPLNYTLDATDFDRDDIYTVTMISMSGPLTSSESVPTDISPYTLCEHPQEVHGTLVSSEGDAIWFFVSSREYTLQCLDGYVPPVGGAIWECDDEAWVRGDDCVIPVVASSSSVLVAVGLGVATVLLLIIGLSVACTKISRGKQIAVQTPNAVVDNVRVDLAIKAAKLHRGNVQASYGNVQASYGNMQPSYGNVGPIFGNVQPSYGNVQPSNQAMSTYGQSKLSSSRNRKKAPISR